MLRESHTLEWRALERNRDQGSIDVLLRGKTVRIERADHRAKLFERSCRRVHAMPLYFVGIDEATRN